MLKLLLRLLAERLDAIHVDLSIWLTIEQAPSYTNVFADALIAEAERDSRIVGIHAAMGGGTGLNRFDARCAHQI